MFAYLAVCFYAFSVPWQNALVLQGIGTIGRGAAILAVGATVLTVLVRARIRPVPAAIPIALLFLFWVGLTMIWALAALEETSTKFGQYLQLVAAFWAVWEVGCTRRRVTGLLLAYVGGGYVAAIGTLLNYRAGIGTENLRYAAAGFDANDLGATLALGIPMAWYLSTTSTRAFVRWTGRLYLPVGALAIFLTGSRGALLTMLVALTIVPLTMGRIRWNVRIAAVLVVLASVVVTINYVPAASWARLASTRSEIESGTLNDRVMIWKAALQVLPARAIQGYGPASFKQAVRPVIGFGLAPHNTFLAILVEEGIVGLVIFLAFLAAVVWPLFSLASRERRFALVLLATQLITLMPLGWETRKPLWLVLSLLVVLVDAFANPSTSTVAARPAPLTQVPRLAPRARRLVPHHGRGE
jgi:hypothetical protein